MVFAYSPSSPSTSYATSTYAMEIPTSTTRSRSNSPSTPVAYPSWGFGASKSTSCIFSDEELFAPVFDESRDVTPPQTPQASRSPAEVNPFEQQRFAVDNGSLLREMAAQEQAKREQQRRRKAAMMRKSSHKSSKKSMTTITE